MDLSSLASMNIFQLRALSEAVNRRITVVAGASSVPPMVPRVSARSAFKHGDMIEFDAKGRGLIRAVVKRLNDKTITCVDVEKRVGYNGNWRVSYGLARLVGADKAPGELPPMKLFAHVPVPPAPMVPKVSAGTSSAAPGAGGW